jgi:cation diffusion facilitator family transporter
MKKNDKITVITCAAAFALNVALFSVKLYVGLCANSISIYSDAVNNMFDSLSGLAAFICFAALLSSSSEGTRAIIKKAEQFFSFVMSVIILLTGLYFAYNSLERLFYPTPISYLTRYLVMLIVTVAVKFVMFFAYRGVYRITGSPIIKVMAADSILDCFITLATVMSLTVSQYVEFAVDAVFGLVISAVLITSAVKLAKKSGAVMLDFVGSGKREEISEIFDSLGVAVDYITYRRTGTEIEAFAKPKFPKNTDENEITQKLVSACKEKGVTLHILKI